MRMYISGQISGLPLEEARHRFAEAALFLEALDLQPVNPFDNGLPDNAPWITHLLRDLEMLNACEAIYMLDGWQQSRGACIEYDFAARLGKSIFFESSLERHHETILRIQGAIHETTGLRLHEYRSKSRKREKFFARMLFAHHARQGKMSIREIAAYIKRDRSSILHLLNKYRDEIKYNPAFRALAEDTNALLAS